MSFRLPILWRNWGPLVLLGLSALVAFGALTPVSGHGEARVNLAAVSRALAAQGFECGAVSASDGLTCIGRLGAYPREVAIVVPPSYRPGTQADWILHLHGHNAGHAPLASLLTRHRFARLLAQSGRNALLLAPWSDGNCVDFEQSLADGASFAAFFDAAAEVAVRAGLIAGTTLRGVSATSQAAAIGAITLTGHSGSYRALATMIGNGALSDRVRELLLIEASYGRGAEFSRFAAGPGHRFWSVYRSEDPDMVAVNPAIMAELKRLGIEYFEATANGPGPADVAGHRLGFAVSQVDHESAVRRYWGVLLGAAALELD